jgi:hypothetical protein
VLNSECKPQTDNTIIRPFGEGDDSTFGTVLTGVFAGVCSLHRAVFFRVDLHYCDLALKESPAGLLCCNVKCWSHSEVTNDRFYKNGGEQNIYLVEMRTSVTALSVLQPYYRRHLNKPDSFLNASPLAQYFSALFHKRNYIRKQFIEYRMCVLISNTFF